MKFLFLLAAALVLTACGGSSGSSAPAWQFFSANNGVNG